MHKKCYLKEENDSKRYNSCSVIETTSTSIYESPGLVFNFCCLLFTGMAPQFYDIFSDFDHICYPNHTLKDTFYLVFVYFVLDSYYCLHKEIFRNILSSFMAQVLLNAVMANLENFNKVFCLTVKTPFIHPVNPFIRESSAFPLI